MGKSYMAIGFDSEDNCWKASIDTYSEVELAVKDLKDYGDIVPETIRVLELSDTLVPKHNTTPKVIVVK